MAFWRSEFICPLREERIAFRSRGLSLVMVGITSLVGMADRIFSLPHPLMRLHPPQSATAADCISSHAAHRLVLVGITSLMGMAP